MQFALMLLKLKETHIKLALPLDDYTCSLTTVLRAEGHIQYLW